MESKTHINEETCPGVKALFNFYGLDSESVLLTTTLTDTLASLSAG